MPVSFFETRKTGEITSKFSNANTLIEVLGGKLKLIVSFDSQKRKIFFENGISVDVSRRNAKMSRRQWRNITTIFSKKYPYIPQVDEMDCGIACQDLLTGKTAISEICP